MLGQLSGVYFQAYKVAFDAAQQAERAFRFERGDSSSSFIEFSYWDSLKKGLFAGERLLLDLRRMEAAHVEGDRRALEITRHISLREDYPVALLELLATGRCQIEVTEALLDGDFPGHYFRRLKTVSLTASGALKPHRNVNCTLTLLENRIRTGANASGSYAQSGDAEDARFMVNPAPIQAVATSRPDADSGLFHLRFDDDRYLPFEGAGAISTWRLELPQTENAVDLADIGDIVLTLAYTARSGGGALEAVARADREKGLARGGIKPEAQHTLSLRRDVPAVWKRLEETPAGQEVESPTLNRIPRWLGLVDDNQVRSWLGLPLFSRRQDEILGILNVDNYRRDAYSPEDIQMAFAFATQAAAAIENARLYVEVRRRADHMAVLNSVSDTVSQSLDLETTLTTALDKALEVVGFEAGAISLVEEEAQELVIRVHRGWRQRDLASNMRVRLGEGLSGQAVLSGEVIVTGSLENETRLAVPQVRDEGVRAMALAPMRARGRVVGVLGVMSDEPRTFAPHSVDVIKSIADQIGVAIDNAQLFARITRRSQQLALLNEVARDVLATLDMSERFRRITRLICEKFGYDAVSVFMIDPDRQDLVLRSSAGSKAHLLDHRQIRLALSEGLVGYAARTGETVNVPEVSQDPRYISPVAPVLDRTRSELAVPMKRSAEVVGVLDIEHTESQAFSAEDAEIMRSLADMLLIAINNGETVRSSQPARG